MKKPPPGSLPDKPVPTIIFALPKPWPQMDEQEREAYVHEWYVAHAGMAKMQEARDERQLS